MVKPLQGAPQKILTAVPHPRPIGTLTLLMHQRSSSSCEILCIALIRSFQAAGQFDVMKKIPNDVSKSHLSEPMAWRACETKLLQKVEDKDLMIGAFVAVARTADERVEKPRFLVYQVKPLHETGNVATMVTYFVPLQHYAVLQHKEKPDVIIPSYDTLDEVGGHRGRRAVFVRVSSYANRLLLMNVLFAIRASIGPSG